MAEYGEWNRKEATLSDITAKKEVGASKLNAGQPVNADDTAGAVAPKLDELLD